MATYAAKTGTQNFSDTWALIEPNSTNFSESTFTNSTTSYVASGNFQVGSNVTIDGLAIWVYSRSNTLGGTFSIKLYNATTSTDVVAITGIPVENLLPATNLFSTTSLKTRGGWVFFKFGSTQNLVTSTNYNIQITTSVAASVSLNVSSGTNYLRYLRTTTTANLAASDRFFVCGEINSSGNWSTNTVNHDSTDSSTTYGRVDVGNYGQWNWNNSSSTNYYFKTNGDIRIGTGGKLQIGTDASPIPSTSTATIDFVSTGNLGNSLALYLFAAGKGSVTMVGADKTHLGYLQSNIAASATSASVSANPSGAVVDPGWKNGDSVLFAAHPTDGIWANHYNKIDRVTITSDSSAGSIGWTGGTTYAHQTYIPHVVNLTRNIKIKGVSTTSTCHILLNTDKINIKNVEVYFVDGLAVYGSDGVRNDVFPLIQNTVVRDCRNSSNTPSSGATSGGISLNLTMGVTLKNCIVAIGTGIFAYSAGAGYTGLIPNFVTNCVSIGNSGSAWTCLGNDYIYNNLQGPASGIIFKSCVATSNNSSPVFSVFTYNDGLVQCVEDCFFGINSGSTYFVPIRPYAIGSNSQATGINKIAAKNCTFKGPGVLLKNAVELIDCTFDKPYSTSTDAYVTCGIVSDYSNMNRKYFQCVLTNCTFTGTTYSNFGFSVADGQLFVNGGSCNNTPTTGSNTYTGLSPYGEILFNNFSCPNWDLSNTLDATTNATPKSAVNVLYKNGLIRFQKFNQVEGDHRVYGGVFAMFSDSTTYDSLPKSIKVACRDAVDGASVTSIKIPMKKNQSAVVKLKAKPTADAASYNFATQVPSGFQGGTPFLKIKANRALGSNYNSDINLFDSASLNGLPNPTDFTPTSLGLDLRLWLDCTNTASISSDSSSYLVSQWNDLSGRGNHIAQSSNGKKPTLVQQNTPFGAKPIRFNGFADERLFINSNIFSGSMAESEIFIVMAFNTTANQPSSSILGFNSGECDINIDRTDLGGGQSGLNGIRVSSQSYTGLSPAIALFTNSGIGIFQFRNSLSNATKKEIRINDVSVGNSSSSAINITPTSFALGAPTESTSTALKTSAFVDIYEIIIVGKRLDATEMDNVYKYLCNKWNIVQHKTVTEWKTLTYNIPAVTDDCVVEAELTIRGSDHAQRSAQGIGFMNIDSITVT